MNTMLQHKIEFDPLMVTNFGSEKAMSSGVGDINNGISSNNHETVDLSDDTMIMNALNDELESVALDWKSARGVKECPCTAPLDFPTPKVQSIYLMNLPACRNFT